MYVNEKLLYSKTFFPQEWSLEDLTEKSFEAVNNAQNHHRNFLVNRNGYLEIIGYTNDGLPVRLIVNNEGTIIGGYPWNPL